MKYLQLSLIITVLYPTSNAVGAEVTDAGRDRKIGGSMLLLGSAAVRSFFLTRIIKASFCDDANGPCRDLRPELEFSMVAIGQTMAFSGWGVIGSGIREDRLANGKNPFCTKNCSKRLLIAGSTMGAVAISLFAVGTGNNWGTAGVLPMMIAAPLFTIGIVEHLGHKRQVIRSTRMYPTFGLSKGIRSASLNILF